MTLNRKRRGTWLASLLLAGLMATANPAHSQAAEPGGDWESVEAADADTLADLRGGVMRVNGIAFDFAAIMKTFIGGELVMQTVLTWTPTGKEVQQTTYGDLAPGQIVNIQSMFAGADFQGLTAQPGIYLAGSGQTVVLQQVNEAGMQNILLNTADGLTIRQDTALTLTLPDMAQAQMQLQQLGMALNRDGIQGAIGAL